MVCLQNIFRSLDQLKSDHENENENVYVKGKSNQIAIKVTIGNHKAFTLLM